MIMPASAISPSSATKPNGWLAMFSPSEAPMMPSGAVRNTRISREKLCSWIISSVSITSDHQRKQHEDRGIALGGFLERAAHLDPVGRLQAVADLLQLRPDLAGDVGRLHAVDDVGAHGDRHVAVAPPQDRLLVGVFDLGDLRQRHRDAVARGDGEIADMAEIEPLGRHRAGDHADLLDAVADRSSPARPRSAWPAPATRPAGSGRARGRGPGRPPA